MHPLRFTTTSLSALALITLSVSAPADAALLTVQNPGFESPDQDTAEGTNFGDANHDGDFSEQVITGWTGTPTVYWGVFDPSDVHYAGTSGDVNPPPGGDGDQVGYITTTGDLISVSQTLADTVVADTTYTLTVAIGSRLDRASAGYTLELLAGNHVIAMETNPSALPAGVLTDRTVTYTSLASDDPYLGQALGIRISNPVTGALLSTDFDNVRLDATTVPEPTAAAMLALGALGLMRRRRSA